MKRYFCRRELQNFKTVQEYYLRLSFLHIFLIANFYKKLILNSALGYLIIKRAMRFGVSQKPNGFSLGKGTDSNKCMNENLLRYILTCFIRLQVTWFRVY
jgi:hypothetical protein